MRALVRKAREGKGSPAALEALVEVLRSREASAMAKAAAVAAEQDLQELRPELLAACTRLLEAPAKADPGCAAKAALVEALDRLGHPEAELFARAIRHVQEEPVWGGRVDTAIDLRGAGAMGLARLDPPDAKRPPPVMRPIRFAMIVRVPILTSLFAFKGILLSISAK